MLNKILLGVLTSVSLNFASSVDAALITFESPQANSGTLGYSEAGLEISAVGRNLFNRIRDRQDDGDKELFFNGTDGAITFSRVGGGTFDLFSFDAEDPGRPFSHFGIFTLSNSNGGLYYGDGNLFGTNIFSNFVDITSFTVSCASSCQATLDNFNFTLNNVPEPSTLALLGLGITGLGYSRRKTKSRQW